MLFSQDYKIKPLEEADEIRCPWNQLGLIYEFIKQHPEKRYNVTIKLSDYINIEKVSQQIEFIKAIVGDNYTIGCDDLKTLNFFKEEGFDRLYLNVPIHSWEIFNHLLNLGVTDILIDGYIAFDMPTIAKLKGNTNIRVCPCYSPNGVVIDGCHDFNSFYIRPEDLKKPCYAEVIDIIEIWNVSPIKEKAYIKMYKEGKPCLYNSDQLVTHLRPGIPIYLLDADGNFASRRSSCREDCIRGGTCHYCNTCANIAKNLPNAVEILENK